MPYVIRPRSWWGWDDDAPVALPSMQVESFGARPTGLLNEKGQEIWNEPDPIGFRFSHEKSNS